MKVLGRTSIKQLIFKDLEEISLPVGMLVDPLNDEVEAPQNPRFQIGKRMDLFVGRVGQASVQKKSAKHPRLIALSLI